MLMSLTDLIALAALLSVTPSVREAVAAYTRGDRKGNVERKKIVLSQLLTPSRGVR